MIYCPHGKELVNAMTAMEIGTDQAILLILQKAKRLAQEYRALTGKPLGITGEVAEYEAAHKLGLELTPARRVGYDAIEPRPDGPPRRLQIKGRCILPGYTQGQRLGRIDTTSDWDAVLLVLLDENFDALEIYEAERADVVQKLSIEGSKVRSQRGELGVRKFKAIGKLRWRREESKVA